MGAPLHTEWPLCPVQRLSRSATAVRGGHWLDVDGPTHDGTVAEPARDS